jgi:hypothetical protein
MAKRLLRVVSVGFLIGLCAHFPCPKAQAEPVTLPSVTLLPLPEYLSQDTPIYQCRAASSQDHYRTPLLRAVFEKGRFSGLSRATIPTKTFSIPVDPELNKLFKKVERHYSTLGYNLASLLHISDLKTVNAFAENQKIVVITRSLLARTRDTSEIAFVIAHELAHIALKHDKNAGVREELEADALALRVVTSMGFNPCSSSTVLERLGNQAKVTLVSVSPRVTALHNKTFSICG